MNAINSPMKAGIKEIYSLILHAFETLSGKKSESPFFRLFFSLSLSLRSLSADIRMHEK